MTLLRLALRAQRTGAIVAATQGAIGGLLNSVGFAQVAGTTHAERVAFAQQMEILGRQLSYFLPPPVGLDTIGGYLTWRNFSSVTLIFAIWAMLAATGAGRGDEERGLVETWVAAGVSRAQWILARATGFLMAAIAALVVAVGLTAVGVAVSGDPLPLGALVLEGIGMLSLTLWGFGLGLLVAQVVTTRRAASTIGGAILAGLFVVNSALRAGADPGPLKWLSPFYLFDRSTPLLPGGPVDGRATIALFVSAALLVAIAGWAFSRRDLGGAAVRRRGPTARPTARPSADRFLRMPVLAAVDQQRGWIAGWAIGLAILGYAMTSIARTIVDSLAAIPSLRVYLERSGINAYADAVGVTWFGTALLLLSIFIVVQVNGWAADDADGRLEMALAASMSRSRVVLERLAALLVATAIVALVSSGGVYLATRVFDIAVPGDRLLVATLLVLPLAFAFGAIGHALVGWRPRLAVLLLSVVAAVSYLILEFAPIFALPEWVRDLSFFVLYGAPLTTVDWGGQVTLMAIGIAGTAVALASMRRRDVGR